MSPPTARRVLVTRPAHQAASLVAALTARGAEVVAVPTVRIGPPEDIPALDRALASLAEVDWLVLTSANGVRIGLGRLQGPLPDGLRIAVVGAATASALDGLGRAPDLVPATQHAEALLTALRPRVHGCRVLLLRSDLATASLPAGLAAAGAEVTDVVAYRTVPGGDPRPLRQALAAGIDVVAFASPSAVAGYLAMAGDATPPACVSIGPRTTRALERAGVPVAAEATPHDAAGLAEAIDRVLTGR